MKAARWEVTEAICEWMIGGSKTADVCQGGGVEPGEGGSRKESWPVGIFGKGTDGCGATGVDPARDENIRTRGFSWSTDNPVEAGAAVGFGLCIDSPAVVGVVEGFGRFTNSSVASRVARGFGWCAYSPVAIEAAGGSNGVAGIQGFVTSVSRAGRGDEDRRRREAGS